MFTIKIYSIDGLSIQSSSRITIVRPDDQAFQGCMDLCLTGKVSKSGETILPLAFIQYDEDNCMVSRAIWDNERAYIVNENGHTIESIH